MLEYWILVTKNARGEIISLYSPDLKKELLTSKVKSEREIHLDEDFDFRVYTKSEMAAALQKRKKVILPKRFEQLESMILSPFQHWERVKIDVKKKRHLFEIGLPVTGQIFNVVAILTNIFITFMALKIASHNSDEDSTQSTGLAISGAIFNSVINLALYILSDASATLAETGTHLDNLCRGTDEPLPESELAQSYGKKSGESIGLAATAGACILTNALINVVRLSLEYTLIADKYLSLDPELSESEHHQYYELIKFLAIVPHIAAVSYTSTAFQSSFARILIAKFTDRKAREEEYRIPPMIDSSTLVLRMNKATEALLDQGARSDEDKQSPSYDGKTLTQFKGTTSYQALNHSDADDSQDSKRSLMLRETQKIEQ